jgi:predicted nucleic-acid-binding Zn-ribbon protein
MTEGFIADYTYGDSNSTAIQNVWVEGEFKTGWLGAKIRDNKKFLTTTFRCENCGYLESYATEEKEK